MEILFLDFLYTSTLVNSMTSVVQVCPPGLYLEQSAVKEEAMPLSQGLWPICKCAWQLLQTQV